MRRCDPFDPESWGRRIYLYVANPQPESLLSCGQVLVTLKLNIVEICPGQLLFSRLFVQTYTATLTA